MPSMPPTGVQRDSEKGALEPAAPESWVDLSSYRRGEYSPGRGVVARALWYAVSLMVFESGWVPLASLKRWLLRCFGARIGRGVIIKPQVTIKYPWRLSIGDHAWIGQQAWIDNLAHVEIGSHVCLSQRVYLCTGSHDHRRSTFDLITAPITIGDGSWVAAGAIVLPGVRIGANVVVSAGTTVRKDVPSGMISWGEQCRPREKPQMMASARGEALADQQST